MFFCAATAEELGWVGLDSEDSELNEQKWLALLPTWIRLASCSSSHGRHEHHNPPDRLLSVLKLSLDPLLDALVL